MANGPTLPPQAYTREILTSAFNWLQSQPESVRKLATTPDALVGLYLRAQRYGSSSLEADAPVSSQNFISDLKNLAEGLKEFEGPQDGRKGVPSSMLSTSLGQQSAPQSVATLVAPQAAPQATIRVTPAPKRAPMPTSVATSMPSLPQMHQMQQVHASAPLHQPAPIDSHRVQVQPPAQTAAYGAMTNETTVTSVSMTSMTSVATSSVEAGPNTTQITGTISEKSQAMIQEVKDAFNLSSDAEAINMLVSIAYRKTKDLLP